MMSLKRKIAMMLMFIAGMWAVYTGHRADAYIVGLLLVFAL